MTVLVADILRAIDELAPFDLAEEWDNVGLLVGHPDRTVSSVMIGLDPTNDLLDEARRCCADTIITHHPLIFHPLSAVITDQSDGMLLEKAIVHQMTMIGCHTNLDSARGGVSDALANGLGLVDLQPLLPAVDPAKPGAGMGRVGRYEESLSSGQFVERLLKVLDLSTVQIAGVLPERVKKVALCGGSGSDLAQAALSCGADLYLSAEIKHSTGRWAEECGFCVIDGTHYGTELPVVALLAQRLREYSKSKGWSLAIQVSTTQRPPFQIVNKETIFQQENEL